MDGEGAAGCRQMFRATVTWHASAHTHTNSSDNAQLKMLLYDLLVLYSY